jgi:hypothetical protein
MVHHHLGHEIEARSWLERVIPRVGSVAAPIEDAALAHIRDPDELLAFQLLVREARAILEKHWPKSPQSARQPWD